MAKASLEERLAAMESEVAELSRLVRGPRSEGTSVGKRPSNGTTLAQNAEQSQLRLTISERILARADKVPASERLKVPADLAEQHDHYVYGWPKK
jgi:hypothetical protein